MFKTIYSYEIKHWLKQPSTYIYALIVFGLAFGTMTGMAGENADRFGGKVLNSSVFLYQMMKRFMLLIFLLMPAIVGMSVYRDFNTKMHTILYSFPFEKWQYLAAKFLSSFTIMMGIAGVLCLGLAIGAMMPWVNPKLVLPFNPLIYIQLYATFLLPNLFLFAAIIFGVVLLSRNIYTGFIAVLMIILIPQLTNAIFSGEDFRFWAGLFDPMGVKAIDFFTRDWTVVESNELAIPFKGVLLYNRLLWMGLVALFGAFVYRSFQFQQTAKSFSLFGNKAAISTSPKHILGNITKVNLPKVAYDFSFLQQIKTAWTISNRDFKFIITSRSFAILVLGGLMFIMINMSMVNARWETETLPMTWQILELPIMFYSGVINAITFLYAGFLVHRERMANMNQLVDITPMPNWVFLGGKFVALIKMQMVLLFIMMISGIATQIYKGYYNFEIWQYIFNLFGIYLIHFVIWAMLALFVHTLINKPYLSFFLLLFMPVGFIGIQEFGPQFLKLNFLEQMMFRYNQAPGEVFGIRYSDMDGYGAVLPSYFIYKIYWFIGGLILLSFALLLWTRGLTQNFKERLVIAKQRFSGKTIIGFATVLIAFLTMGFGIYYESNIQHTYYSRVEKRNILAAAEKKYKRYEKMLQPKIISVKVNMDIFPASRQFKGSGEYIIVNNTKNVIDTLIINYLPNTNIVYDFEKKYKTVSKEAIGDLGHFDILVLEEGLQAGEKTKMTFENHNDPMTLLRSNNFVKENGTYIQDDVFPRLGNWLSFFKEANDMGHNDHRHHPSDCSELTHSFMAKDADRINFECVVSTSKDQTAIAPGYLQKEWTENNRRYFHYKMDKKIALSYLFMSGDYEVARDQYQPSDASIEPINVEVYFDKKHPYNIDRMLRGLKDGLAYCNENFSPYQFKQIRMVEFSQTGGASAHGFPNTIPAGEGVGFIADIDDSAEGGTDYAYGTAVHEVAHQWWGHQVLPADVLGSKLVIESLCEYVNVQVKKKELGIDKARQYLKLSMQQYLKKRIRDYKEESPLMYAFPSQNYIHYPKGALALYAMSEYMGEQNLNAAIQKYVEAVAFQEGTYTTSIEFVDFIKKDVPDSLQYLVKDLFETVTLYDNKIISSKTTALDNGKYQVDIDFSVRKYRNGDLGRPIYSDNAVDSLSYTSPDLEVPLHSLPLADYMEIGVFGKDKKELYLQKHHITKISNSISIVVDELPEQVGVDPYYLLIDKAMGDNFGRCER